jgi:hypothetical protein
MPATLTVWAWTWGPAGGPAADARFGDNPAFDVIRLGVVIAGMLLMWLCGRVIVEQARRHDAMGRAQAQRFAALALAAFYIAGTEAWVVGTTATPRLLVGAAVVVVGIVGTIGKRDRQKREPLR